MDKVKELRAILERRKGKKEELLEQIKEKTLKLKKLKAKQIVQEKSLVVIQEVAKLTHRKLERDLCELSSLSLKSVFEDDLSMETVFVSKRNKVEVYTYFNRKNSDKLTPTKFAAGGEKNIASLGFRFSCYGLSKNKTRPIMILDEPNAALKGEDYPEKGAEMLKEMANLGFQIIMVSHDPELIKSADNVITVEKKKGESKCHQKKEND